MGYWDYTPSSHHPKKPLTRAQIRKMQEAYASADAITSKVKDMEGQEQSQTREELERTIQILL
jgi:hypothetical protein